jgi:DEAD/DEAH box helicase domain-containing protein
MMGSRAPSLLSVAISDIFTNAFNEDKKILAFTDSVQDASHRAGFFGARTYRFNIRTAIQGLLEPDKSAVSLPDYARQMFEFWEQDSSISIDRLISTLMPPDLREYPKYLSFLNSGGRGSHRHLQEDLVDRLSWEITMEYGLRSRVGRTLETTRCSTVRLDESVLDDAAERLLLELNEDSPLDGRTGGFERDEVRHFLRGLLNRTRLRGGISHPFLKSYIENGGNRWHLRKAREPLLSPFGPHSVFPRFLTNYVPAQGARDVIFDSIIATTTSHTWYRDWASRCFGVAVNDPGTNNLYDTVMTVLSSAGAVIEYAGRSNSKVWGIDPAVLAITRETNTVSCLSCGTEAIVPAEDASSWEGRTCTMYRCEDSFAVSERQVESYYSRIYKSGKLYRVFPNEHTGLLRREDREDIEEAFRTQERPNGPNMLVATPTLEMGIDIGDLSALVLCAVPPSTANFIQRVGRAGRKTGNALCMTLVNARPHDLYFHEMPEEMMAGSVVPPGCFLDTPEMLKRQMVAHGMDAWSREDEDAGSIPQQVRYIKDAAEPTKFPGRFISYYKKNQAALTESFLKRFSEELSVENQALLETFGNGDDVPNCVINAIA